MGVRASFTVVPGAEFTKHKDDLLNFVVPKEYENLSIDKAWHEFQIVFRGLPKPLSLVIQGDHPAYGHLAVPPVAVSHEEEDDNGEDEDDCDDEDEDDGEEGTYLAFCSPALAKKIDKALEEFSDEQLLAAIEEARCSCGTKDAKQYYSSQFTALKGAYRKAASEGAALQIFID